MDHKMELQPTSSVVLGIDKKTPPTSSQIYPIKWLLSEKANDMGPPGLASDLKFQLQHPMSEILVLVGLQ